MGKSRTAEKTICLTMIIKNESKIIERCLNSVVPICDYMTICDTGSTDNTVDLVEKFFRDHDVKGTLYHHEWKNFGHNRCLSLEVASQSGADYILCLDADMILNINSKFEKRTLEADFYTIPQRSSSLFYYNTRLMKATLNWKCIGVTHEYYGCDEAKTNGKIDTLIIEDIGDGGAKADKFERDIRLLTQGLIDEPDNERYMFYLAQSYKDIGKYDNAIDYYQKRIDKGGWQEEVWYSYYMMGYCYEQMDDWPNALATYLSGYDYYPSRSENIYNIAKYYRIISKHMLSYTFIKLGLQIPFPYKDKLFVNQNIYSWDFLWELSIIAYYLKMFETGMLACEKIARGIVPYKEKMQNKTHPNITRILSNELFYLKRLGEMYRVTYQSINIPVTEGWSVCNPCIVSNPCVRNKNKGGYTLLVRSVNYQLDPETGGYTFDLGDCDTTTYVVDLEQDEVRFKSSKPITRNNQQKTIKHPKNDETVYYPFPVNGFEDVRIIKHKNQLYGFATTRQLNPEGRCVIVLLPLDSTYRIKKVIPLRGYEDTRHQKNWLPFIHNNKIHILYSCDPTVVLIPDLKTGDCKSIVHENHYNMVGFRGGSPGIVFNLGHLFMIHEVIMSGTKKIYTHRFIYMDSNLNITHFSRPFIFKDKTTEFVSGLEMDVTNKYIIICLGYQDKEAYIVKMRKDDVDDSLRWSEHLHEPIQL